MWCAEVPQNVPPDGDGHGDTLFCDVVGAWATVDAATRDALRNATAHHARPLRPDDAGTTHPALRPHPVSGDARLYVNPGYTRSVCGLPDDASAALLARVFEHCLAPRFQLRYRWRPGDLVVWDNASVWHRATTRDMPRGARRLMFRASVVGGLAF